MRYDVSIVSILLLTQYVYCSFNDDLRYIECNTKSTLEEFSDVFSNLYNRSFDLNFKFKHHFYDEEYEFDERTQQGSCASTLYNYTSPLHIDEVIVQLVTLSFKWLPQFINGLLNGYNLIKIPMKAGFNPIISNVIKTLLFHYNDLHYTNNYTDTNPNINMTDTAEYSTDKISALIELGGGMGYGMQVYCDGVFVYTLGGGNGGGLEYQYKTTTTTKQWNHHEADTNSNNDSNSTISSDEQKSCSAYSYDHYSYGGGGGGGIQIDTNFLCNSSSSTYQEYTSDSKDNSDRPDIDRSICSLLSEMSSSYYDTSTGMISYGGGGGCGTHKVGSNSSTYVSEQDLNTSSSTSDTTQFDIAKLDIHRNKYKTYLVCGTQTDGTYPRNMTILSIFMKMLHKKLSTCNQIRIDGGGGGGGGGVFHPLKSTCTSYDPENGEGTDLYKGYGYGYHFTMVSTLDNTSTSMSTSDSSDLDFMANDDDADHEYDETLILHDNSHIRSAVHVSSIGSTDNSSDATNMTSVVSKNDMPSESKYVTTNLSTLSSPYGMIEWASNLVYDYRYSYRKQRDISSTRSTDTAHISYMESKRESSDINSILTSRRLIQKYHANKFDTPGHIISTGTTYNFLDSFSFLWSSVLFEDDISDHVTTADTMGSGHSGVDSTSIAEIDLTPNDSDSSSKDVNEYVSQRNRLLHVLDPIYMYNTLIRHDSDNITADHNLNHDRLSQVTQTYMKYLHSVSLCDYIHIHPMSLNSVFNLTVLGPDSLSPKCIDFVNNIASLDDIVMTENWQLIYRPKIIQSLQLCLNTILLIPQSTEDGTFDKTDTPIQYEWQNDEIHIVHDSCDKDTSAVCHTLNLLFQQLLDVILCPPLSLLMEEYHHTIDYMIIQLQQTICPDLWLPSLLSPDNPYHNLDSSSDEIKDGNITIETIKEEIDDFTIKCFNTSQRINSSVVVETYMYINIDNRTHSINGSYVDHGSTLYLYQSSQLKDQSEHDANHTNCIECHEINIIYLMYYMIGVTATLQLLTRHYVHFYTINTDYNPHAIYIIPTTVDNQYLQV